MAIEHTIQEASSRRKTPKMEPQKHREGVSLRVSAMKSYSPSELNSIS